MKEEVRNSLLDLFDTICEEIEESLNQLKYNIEDSEDVDEYDGIKSIDNFIEESKKDGVYSKELEDFINHYLKYHNN